MVRIHVYPPISKMLGLVNGISKVTQEVNTEPNHSLRDLFEHLAVEYSGFLELADDEHGKLLSGVWIIVDGKMIVGEKRMETLLRDNAEVLLMPSYRGG